MGEFFPRDAELLAQDLPELAQVAIASSIYPGHRGQVEYRDVAKGRVVGDARDAELDSWLRTADTSIPVSRASVADRLLTPNTPPLVRQHVERLRDAMTTDGWRQAIRSLFSVYTPDTISEVRCPITILSGTRDQVAPHRDHVEPLLAAAPRAASRSFEDCGHMLKLEAPSRFNAIVRETALQPESTVHPNH
jgi:pimeloyl-ACP methyl ester carboxylesterase